MYLAQIQDIAHQLHRSTDYYEGVLGYNLKTLRELAYQLQDIAALSRTHCPHCSVQLEEDKDGRAICHCPECKSSFLRKAIRG